jgi:hypothetical protein
LASIPNPLSQTTLADVEIGYGAALALAVNYRDACAAREIPPSCRPVVRKLQTYGALTQTGILQARAFVKNNPTDDAAVIVNQAAQALATFVALERSNGIK